MERAKTNIEMFVSTELLKCERRNGVPAEDCPICYWVARRIDFPIVDRDEGIVRCPECKEQFKVSWLEAEDLDTQLFLFEEVEDEC